MPWWYPWLKAARYMNGAVTLWDLLEKPLGPVWRDRMLIAQEAETQARAIMIERQSGKSR